MRIILVITVLLCIGIADAKNLGTYGRVYQIAEQDFLEYVQGKAIQLQKTGELTEMQASLQKRSMLKAVRPMPVPRISRAKANVSHLYNPSITIPYDVRDATGRIIIPSGMRVNPLDTVSFSKIFVFLNADDIKQLKWFEKYLVSNSKPVKLILVKGDIRKSSVKFKRPVYFDQEGRLTQKFSIEHVPATVEQSGKRLLVKEHAV